VDNCLTEADVARLLECTDGDDWNASTVTALLLDGPMARVASIPSITCVAPPLRPRAHRARTFWTMKPSRGTYSMCPSAESSTRRPIRRPAGRVVDPSAESSTRRHVGRTMTRPAELAARTFWAMEPSRGTSEPRVIPVA
jgi:hypothetical protein